MATFTSTLPDDLLERLSLYAKKLKMPKNKLIEASLTLYLDHLKRAEYIQSYKAAVNDDDMVSLAEEGMEEYLTQLENEAG